MEFVNDYCFRILILDYQNWPKYTTLHTMEVK